MQTAQTVKANLTRVRPPGSGRPRRTRRSRGLSDILVPVISVLTVLIIWESAVRIFAIPAYILPAPSQVALYLSEHTGVLLENAWATMLSSLIGFTLAVIGGVAIAVLMVSSRFIEQAAYPILVANQVTPVVAIAPLLIVYFGYGAGPKIFLAFLIAFFPIVINAMQGMRSVRIELLEFLESLRASRWQVLRKARLPNAVPQIIEASKIAITLAVIGTVVSEFTSGSTGLGYVISSAMTRLDVLRAFAALFTLILMGILLFALIRLLGSVALRRWERGRG